MLCLTNDIATTACDDKTMDTIHLHPRGSNGVWTLATLKQLHVTRDFHGTILKSYLQSLLTAVGA